MERINTPELAKAFIEEQIQDIKAQVGDKKVLLALSGGVDSSVVAALLIKAIGKQLVCVHVNHGLLRKGEPEQVIKVFKDEMDANALIDFWRSIFVAVKDRQEHGIPVRYDDVICEDLCLRNRRFNSIPDLVGVDVTDELVCEFLRRSLVPKAQRFDEDLRSITLPGEEWKTIPGYSRYKASTLGRIWTSWSGKLLKPQMNGQRYPTVCVYNDDRKVRRASVHRLVAITFLPNPEGYSTVDHINEDHMFVVVNARKGTISYKTAMEKLPDELTRYFSGKNLMIIFPDQYGDSKDSMTFTETQHREETSIYENLLEYLKRRSS